MNVKKMSDKELQALRQQADVELQQRASAGKRQTTQGALNDLDAYHELAAKMMSDWWDDDEAEGLKSALLALGGSASEVEAIIDLAGWASNNRSELESMSDEEPEYGELERAYEHSFDGAMLKIEKLWKKYSAKKSGKKTAEPRKR